MADQLEADAITTLLTDDLLKTRYMNRKREKSLSRN